MARAGPSVRTGPKFKTPRFRPNPCIGISLLNATDLTPEIATSLSAMSFCMRVTRSASGTSEPGIEIWTVWRCSGCVNPGSTLRSDWNVRIINPALTNSTSAIAT